MKINGKPVAPPSPVSVTIYRDDESGKPCNITFLCGAVLDYEPFNALCPIPRAPLVTDIKTGISRHDTTDKKYDAKLTLWSERRTIWMILQSLRSTPGLEWEKVDLNNPNTWEAYKDELHTCFTESEANAIVYACIEANSPSENRRKEAIENFSSTQAEPANQDSISLAVEPTITLSGEHVNESASVPQV